jgi:hypothetical protein
MSDRGARVLGNRRDPSRRLPKTALATPSGGYLRLDLPTPSPVEVQRGVV